MKECIQYSKKYCAPFSDRFKVRDLQFCTKGKVTRSQPFSVYFQIDGFNWWDILSPLFKYFTFKSMILMAAFEFCHAGIHWQTWGAFKRRTEGPKAASHPTSNCSVLSAEWCHPHQFLYLCPISQLPSEQPHPAKPDTSLFPGYFLAPAPDIVLHSFG